MDIFRSKISQNYPKTHCSVTLVAIAGEVVLGEEGEEVVGAHVLGEQVGAIRGEGLGTEGAEDAGTSAVLGRGDPLEVGGTVVKVIAVEMIAFGLHHLLRYYECGAWTMPGGADEHVTGATTALANDCVACTLAAKTPRGIGTVAVLDLVPAVFGAVETGIAGAVEGAEHSTLFVDTLRAGAEIDTFACKGVVGTDRPCGLACCVTPE